MPPTSIQSCALYIWELSTLRKPTNVQLVACKLKKNMDTLSTSCKKCVANIFHEKTISLHKFGTKKLILLCKSKMQYTENREEISYRKIAYREVNIFILLQ